MVEFRGRKNPAIEIPPPHDILITKARADIILGPSYVLNHLIANADGELITNMSPTAIKKVPKIAHAGS
jgi:hypothetical protein